MTKLSKMTIAVLMASAISVSAVPSTFAGQKQHDNWGKVGAAGAGLAAGLIIGAIANASKLKAPNNGDVNLGPVGQKSRSDTNKFKGGSKPQNTAKTKQQPAAKGTTMASTAPKAKVAPVADQKVLEAQKNLASLGYNQVGTPDGFAGKGTAAAVMAFQTAHAFAPTGKLDDGLMAFIEREAKQFDADTAKANSQTAGTNEMTQGEYAEAVRNEGRVFDSEEIQKAPEPVKPTSDQPVGLALAPAVNKSALVDTTVQIENPVQSEETSDVLKNDLFN